MPDTPTLEEFTALQQALARAREQNESLAGELRVTRTERDLLKEQLNKFKRQLFAASSEVAGLHQKDLFFNKAESLGSQAAPAAEETDDDKIDVPGHKRAKRGRKPLDPALPREVVRHELPEGERVCPHDGAVLREIGVEVSEQLDIVPQQVRVIRHERVKYACPCCDGALRLAAKPAQIIPRGLFTDNALAWIATSKYLDGLPLYRQAALLGRFGGTDISRNTVAASIVRVGQAVQPVVNLLRDELLEAPLVFGDETELQVLKEAGRSAQARSYVWAQMTDGSGRDGTGPPIRLFSYSPSRSAKTALELYAGIRPGAVLMSDGYEVYDTVARAHQLVHLGCWTHCRRYFVEALQAVPKEQRGPQHLAAQFIALIGQLYQVEAQARREGIDAQELGRRRKRDSAPVLADIEALLLVKLHAVLPKSLLGQALHYLASQWSKLRRYVEDGCYSIDNNAQENAIRPFCVGRRNWLFADTVVGAQASANLYSLLQTCRVNGIDGYQYLRALFARLPQARTVDDYVALLPWRIDLTAA
ncbi:IS66 family transposase [Caldimonas tepidiphila]|uniref:IS66 family transposase n=1 Tax=Caldimonas tepidiphila TaxID=2315841 RepID=UPI000E5ABCAB|nr:IS66 family transposase [Caldimonas tepidiphila]